MERLIAVLGFGAIAMGLLGLGIWWVRGQRELHARGDRRALLQRKQQIRRILGWILVGLLLAGAIAIVAGALSR